MRYVVDSVEGILIGLILTALSYLVAYTAKIPITDGWIEITGTILNYACVYLTVKQKAACWPLGILAVIFLGWLFYDLKLYASMFLSIAYFFPIQFWGWYEWLYGGKHKTELSVSTFLLSQNLLILIIVAPLYLMIVYIDTLFGAASPFLDTIILTASIIAQFILSYKKLESWILWILVNITSIYVYYQAGAPIVAIQYFLFLGNAFYGLISWQKELKNA